MKVPFNDLSKLHSSFKNELVDSFANIVDSSAFIGGRHVEDFELNFANKLGVKHCIGVGSGTAALWSSFMMLGFGKGDEIILPANTFFACAEAVCLCGAKPIFVDNDMYFNIDADKIVEKITKKTKAILAVHLYGQACNLELIGDICKSYNLVMVEDCSQSHFAKFDGRMLGTFGKIAAFSFYPGKNLGAMGDAGCVVTNDDDLAHKIRLFRNHGEYQKSKHQIVGFNSRLDAIQAAILNIKLKYIEDWNAKRQQAAKMYYDLLKDCKEIALPLVLPTNLHAYHLFVIKAQKRDELQVFLSNNNIGTGIHYPISLPFVQALKYLNHSECDYPVSYKNQDLILSLPIFPDITSEQIEYVSSKIIEFYTEKES